MEDISAVPDTISNQNLEQHGKAPENYYNNQNVGVKHHISQDWDQPLDQSGTGKEKIYHLSAASIATLLNLSSQLIANETNNRWQDNSKPRILDNNNIIDKVVALQHLIKLRFNPYLSKKNWSAPLPFPHPSLLTNPTEISESSVDAKENQSDTNWKENNAGHENVIDFQKKKKLVTKKLIGFQKHQPKKGGNMVEKPSKYLSLNKLPKIKDQIGPNDFKITPPSDDNIEEDKDDCILKHPRNGELSQRRDVIFKTIIRDMRKFFIEDFNTCTGYVKRKRYKRKDFYLTWVDEYILEEHIRPASLKNGRPIKDFNIYCGALIYPKELESIISKKSQKKLSEEIYDALYKFSLGKMKNLLMKDAIYNLFMTYHDHEIKHGDRLNTNKTMKKHQVLYVEAYKILVNINKRAHR